MVYRVLEQSNEIVKWEAMHEKKDLNPLLIAHVSIVMGHTVYSILDVNKTADVATWHGVVSQIILEQKACGT